MNVYGAFADAHDLGDFGSGKIQVVAEYHGLALPCGQPPDRISIASALVSNGPVIGPLGGSSKSSGAAVQYQPEGRSATFP